MVASSNLVTPTPTESLENHQIGSQGFLLFKKLLVPGEIFDKDADYKGWSVWMNRTRFVE